jgi:DNA-directed RNA polymerase subunit delta
MSNPNQFSDVELAYQILHKSGQAMYFRDLITEVLEMKGLRVHSPAHAIAEVHTQINMDSRFVHRGKGMWGLVDWSPQVCASSSEDGGGKPVPANTRREKLFEEIQQEYVTAVVEPADKE